MPSSLRRTFPANPIHFRIFMQCTYFHATKRRKSAYIRHYIIANPSFFFNSSIFTKCYPFIRLKVKYSMAHICFRTPPPRNPWKESGRKYIRQPKSYYLFLCFQNSISSRYANHSAVCRVHEFFFWFGWSVIPWCQSHPIIFLKKSAAPHQEFFHSYFWYLLCAA